MKKYIIKMIILAFSTIILTGCNSKVLQNKSDSLESITKEELSKEFGNEIADMVFCVSGFGPNRQEKQKDIHIKLQTNVKSVNLKMCDRLANLRTSKLNKPKLFQRYCKEHELFELDALFSQGNKNLFLAIQIALDKEIVKPKKTMSL